jgi:hypothetical protein
MKRTLLVLALAVLASAGCRAIGGGSGPGCGDPCGQPCGSCGQPGCESPCCESGCEPGCDPSCDPACDPSCEPYCEPCEACHTTRANFAPRPIGPIGGAGRGGNFDQDCPGGQGCCFDRYCGSQCGPGYHPGPYDCSPCGSPHWGCTGHRHPVGYVDGRGCLCQNCGHCHPPGPGYCCGGPAPGCCNSGDQYYNFSPGPPVAQTAYPYYTLRGPRDFLLNNPPPIGPY